MKCFSWRYPSAIALGLACAACGDGGNEDEMGAAALLDQVQAEGYRGWQRVPGWEIRQPSVSVHGQTADIFMNEVLALALMTPNLTVWPVGSLLAKDAYNGSDLGLIALMEKRQNGWFFAEFGADESVKYSGSPDVCLAIMPPVRMRR